jgi:hypothetical protein
LYPQRYNSNEEKFFDVIIILQKIWVADFDETESYIVSITKLSLKEEQDS